MVYMIKKTECFKKVKFVQLSNVNDAYSNAGKRKLCIFLPFKDYIAKSAAN